MTTHPGIIAHRDECAAELGIDVLPLLARNRSGALLRGGGLSEFRRQLCVRMREKKWNGITLSYPEIAAACGIASHASVIELVNGRRGSRRRREVERVGIKEAASPVEWLMGFPAGHTDLQD